MLATDERKTAAKKKDQVKLKSDREHWARVAKAGCLTSRARDNLRWLAENRAAKVNGY